jgi:hypothetical protein
MTEETEKHDRAQVTSLWLRFDSGSSWTQRRNGKHSSVKSGEEIVPWESYVSLACNYAI